jgi:hypothetical protein
MEQEVFDNLKGLDISYSSEHSREGGERKTNLKMNGYGSVMSKKDDQDSIHMEDSDLEGGKKSTAHHRHQEKQTSKHEKKPGGDDDDGDYV